MSVITRAKLRRLIPVGAVATVLAFSYLAPLPSLASNVNNCGVKGYGYHDHGKACPNRPFPGHGNGLAKFGITMTAPAVGHAKESVVPHKAATTSSVGDHSTTTLNNGDAKLVGKSHGHAKSYGRGNSSNHQ